MNGNKDKNLELVNNVLNRRNNKHDGKIRHGENKCCRCPKQQTYNKCPAKGQECGKCEKFNHVHYMCIDDSKY